MAQAAYRNCGIWNRIGLGFGVGEFAGVFAKITYFLVRLAGIEPTTLGFGGQYSIH